VHKGEPEVSSSTPYIQVVEVIIPVGIQTYKLWNKRAVSNFKYRICFCGHKTRLFEQHITS